MGYLSQKKKHARINFLLNTSLGIISITSFLALFDRSSGFSAFINQWQFQIYIYLLFVFFYALANRFFIQALFACLLIVVNYMLIASSANLFKNIENDGQQRLVILYQNHTLFIHACSGLMPRPTPFRQILYASDPGTF